MTDDDRLADLFRAAASDPGAPAPGFDHDDVLSASRRITARRRSAVIGGAVALFAVVGLGAAVALPDTGETMSSAAAPAAADQAEAGRAAPEPAVPEQAAPAGGAGQGAAGQAARQGAAESGNAASGAAPDAAAPPFAAAPPGVPLGPGTGDCADRQDPALRALLEQVLPQVSGAPAAATTDECLPAGQRHLSLQVQDGGLRGLLSVSYLPPGTPVEPAVGTVSAPTASGGTVVVRTGPVGGTAPAPFLDRLGEVAGYLAPRL